MKLEYITKILVRAGVISLELYITNIFFMLCLDKCLHFFTRLELKIRTILKDLSVLFFFEL